VRPEWRTAAIALFQGFTMAGLSRKVDIPGLPTRLFNAEPDEESNELLRRAEKCQEGHEPK